MGKAALQKYLNLGGNFIGVHCASDALRDTPFFGKQLGKFRVSAGFASLMDGLS